MEISYSSSEWRFSCSLSGNIGPHPIVLTIESRMVSIFWACSPISFKHIFFLVPILRSTPNHVPLKYRRVDYWCFGIKHVYLNDNCDMNFHGCGFSFNPDVHKKCLVGQCETITTMIGWDPSVCKSNRLHVDILRFFSKVMGNSPEVLMNFNRLFLKLNRFICN
jgi:hypothetical protein